MGKGQDKSICLSHVDDQEIIRIVQNFKSKMSSDYNDINMSTIKTFITQIVIRLNHICNVSFKTEIFITT